MPGKGGRGRPSHLSSGLGSTTRGPSVGTPGATARAPPTRPRIPPLQGLTRPLLAFLRVAGGAEHTPVPPKGGPTPGPPPHGVPGLTQDSAVFPWADTTTLLGSPPPDGAADATVAPPGDVWTMRMLRDPSPRRAISRLMEQKRLSGSRMVSPPVGPGAGRRPCGRLRPPGSRPVSQDREVVAPSKPLPRDASSAARGSPPSRQAGVG